LRSIALLDIIRVRSEADADEVRLLVGEYRDWLTERYPEDGAIIAAYWQNQDIPGQLARLLTLFAPPSAECLLARLNGVPVGTVMTKLHSGDMCEMNRMFVRPSARGHRVGRALVSELLVAARGLGYGRMMLVVGPNHTEALALYCSLGFTEDPNLPDTGAGDIEMRLIRDL
jgi:GNAT superfamily N-acetyltransferase